MSVTKMAQVNDHGGTMSHVARMIEESVRDLTDIMMIVKRSRTLLQGTVADVLDLATHGTKTSPFSRMPLTNVEPVVETFEKDKCSCIRDEVEQLGCTVSQLFEALHVVSRQESRRTGITADAVGLLTRCITDDAGSCGQMPWWNERTRDVFLAIQCTRGERTSMDVSQFLIMSVSEVEDCIRALEETGYVDRNIATGKWRTVY